SANYGETLSAKVKGSQKDPLKATFKGISAYEGLPAVGGACKYSLKRTPRADPGVAPGPAATPAPSATATPIPTATPGPRFVDNGDGTVTDNQTGLQWEKKGNICVGGDNVGAYCTVASQCSPGGGT